MLILSEYYNDKKTFNTIYEHHCLVRKLNTRGVMSHAEQGQEYNFKSIQKGRVKNNKIKWIRKHRQPQLPRESMAGTVVTQQPPVLLRQMNQVQEMGDKDAAK